MSITYEATNGHIIKKKITEEVFIREDLEKEIEDLKNDIANIEFLEYPENSSNEIMSAIDLYNIPAEEIKAQLENRLDELNTIIKNTN